MVRSGGCESDDEDEDDEVSNWERRVDSNWVMRDGSCSSLNCKAWRIHGTIWAARRSGRESRSGEEEEEEEEEKV